MKETWLKTKRLIVNIGAKNSNGKIEIHKIKASKSKNIRWKKYIEISKKYQCQNNLITKKN